MAVFEESGAVVSARDQVDVFKVQTESSETWSSIISEECSLVLLIYHGIGDCSTRI